MMKNLQFINTKKCTQPLRLLRYVLIASISCTFTTGCISARSAGPAYSANITITDTKLSSINEGLFGKVLEKSISGKPGPEQFIDAKTGTLSTNVLDLIRHTHSPLMIFPGSTSDYFDLRDTISNAPGKHRFRPLTASARNGSLFNTRFGIDEFWRLKQELGCQAVLVVNLLDGLSRRGPVREAAERASGLVAYCNSQYSVDLPRYLWPWSGARAKNGHPLPFDIEYVQVGSGLSSQYHQSAVKKALPNLDTKQLAQWYVDCITAYLRAIRAADPEIKIILDAEMGQNIEDVVFANKYINDTVDLVSCKGDRLASCARLAAARNKPLAITHWAAPDSLTAHGEYMNNLLRHGDIIKIAAQGPLLGSEGMNAIIRVTEENSQPAQLTSIGRVSALYATRHGSRLLKIESSTQEEPLSLDSVATVSKTALYLHAVNSSPTESALVTADCRSHSVRAQLTLRSITGSGSSSTNLTIKSAAKIRFSLPPNSVSVVELPLAP